MKTEPYEIDYNEELVAHQEPELKRKKQINVGFKVVVGVGTLLLMKKFVKSRKKLDVSAPVQTPRYSGEMSIITGEGFQIVRNIEVSIKEIAKQLNEYAELVANMDKAQMDITK